MPVEDSHFEKCSICGHTFVSTETSTWTDSKQFPTIKVNVPEFEEPFAVVTETRKPRKLVLRQENWYYVEHQPLLDFKSQSKSKGIKHLKS